jgi:hypothetical protein
MNESQNRGTTNRESNLKKTKQSKTGKKGKETPASQPASQPTSQPASQPAKTNNVTEGI